MHKLQGFGNTGSRGNQVEYLELLKGDFPKNNIFEGVNTTWSRLNGGKAIGEILYPLEGTFNFKDPSANIPQLLEAYKLIKTLPDSHWKGIKMEEIKELIIDCTGLYLEAVSDQQRITPNGDIQVTIEAINRSNATISLGSVSSNMISFPLSYAPTPLLNNEKYSLKSTEHTFNRSNYSTSYWWLKETGSLGMYRVDDKDLIGLPELRNQFPVNFNFTINGVGFSVIRNIVYKFNDPVKGEVYRPFEILPEVTSKIPEKVIVFSTNEAREIPVEIRAGKDTSSGTLSLQYPKGWLISPDSHSFNIKNRRIQNGVI